MRPFITSSPEIKTKRQAEHVLIGGGSEVQDLGYYTSKSWRMFWATEAEVNAQIVSIQAAGWVLDGEPSLTPIYAPLDLFDASIEAHRHTSS